MTRTRILLIPLMGTIAVSGAVAAFLVLGQPPQQTPPAGLVLRGGRIVTLDDHYTEALAARDGRIVAVGSIAEISDDIGSSTQVIELNGQVAMPGFIEGHGHCTGIGENKIITQTREASRSSGRSRTKVSRHVSLEPRVRAPPAITRTEKGEVLSSSAAAASRNLFSRPRPPTGARALPPSQ